MDNEAVSVGHLQQIIGECPHLTPYIDQKDRTPLTDGHIDINAEKGQPRNATISGRAQVQVKGRSVGQGQTPKTSYQLDQATLRGYLKIGGLLLLVVDSVGTGPGSKKHVHYATLTPLHIDSILKDKPNQNYYSVHLKPLPQDSEGVEAVIRYVALAHNQNPEAIATSGVWERAAGVQISASHHLDPSKPIQLDATEHDFSVKVTTQDGAQAFSKMNELLLLPEAYVGQPLGKPVSSGSVTFNAPIWRQVDDDTIALDLSETLSLYIDRPGHEGQGGRINCEMNNSFDKHLKDIKFATSVVDNNGVYVGDRFFGWQLESSPDDTELRKRCRHLECIAELFWHIGARTDLLDLSAIEDSRHRQLRNLHSALVEQEGLVLDGHRQSGAILQPVGEWSLGLMVFQGAGGKGARVYDLMSPDLQHLFYAQDEDGEGSNRFPVTAYEVVKEYGDFSRMLNLGLDRIVDIYSPFAEYDHTNNMANRTVLALIDAADQAPTRLEEFLAAAQNLNAWLASQCGEDSASAINRLQIEHRRRQLTPEERATLRRLFEQAIQGEGDQAELTAFSCSVLLGNMESAGDHFERVSPEWQEELQEWPIYTLWVKADR